MFDLLMGNPLALLSIGWFAATKLGGDKGPAQGAPQGQLPQGSAVVGVPIGAVAPHPGGGPQGAQGRPEWAPGMPQGSAPPAPRKPLGPVALDAGIAEETESDVWKCVGDHDEDKARQFAASLAKCGLPVAAAVVAMHATYLAQAKAFQAAQAAREIPPGAKEHANGKVPAPAAGSATEDGPNDATETV